jgi:hypothetical protein
MTITIKQHYRTVNGKLILVHEGHKDGEAAHHETPHFHGNTDTHGTFDHLFSDAPEEAPAQAQAQDDPHAAFDQLMGDLDKAPETTEDDPHAAFDKLLVELEGNQSEAVVEPQAEPSLDELIKVGKEWKQGDKHNVYFNGLKKWNDGTYDGMDKGAKIWLDATSGEWHSKLMTPETFEKVKAGIKKDALAMATPEPEAQSVDSDPKPGDAVPFDKLKLGMKLEGPNGSIATVEKFEDGKVFLSHPGATGGQMLGLDEAKWNANWLDNLKLQDAGMGFTQDQQGDFSKIMGFDGPQPVDSDMPKAGEKVPFDKLEVGMKLKAPSGVVATIADVSEHGLKLTGKTGHLHEWSKDQWASANLVYDGGHETVDTKTVKPGEKPTFDLCQPGQDLFDKQDDAKWSVVDKNSASIKVTGPEEPNGQWITKDVWNDSYAPYLEAKERAESSGPKVGEVPSFDQLKPGMVVKPDSGSPVIIIAIDGDHIISQHPSGETQVTTKASWEASAGKIGFKLSSKTDNVGKTDLKMGVNVGDTKTLNGKLYVLNANHRWELVENASDTHVKLSDMGYGDTAQFGNIAVAKHAWSGSYYVSKTGVDGKPLPKKVKDALLELHPADFLKKKSTYLIPYDKLGELAEILDGKIKPKEKPQKPDITPLGMTTVDALQVAEGFPYKKVGDQKGSNPGGFYEDNHGQKWYIKFPKTEDHARNELLASKLYEAMGINGPSLKLVKKDGVVGIASKFVDGLDVVKDSSLLAKQAGVKEGFAADAWLANWDAIGLNNDNLLLGNDGNGYRIDVGGSLLYRAMGEAKDGDFGDTVNELHTMRDLHGKNKAAAAVFHDMTDEEVKASVANVMKITDNTIIAMVKSYGPGTPKEKDALAQKLIARKQYLAKRFPDALKANFNPANISTPPNFEDFYGETSKGPQKGGPLSTSEDINKANNFAVGEVFDAAKKGDVRRLKELKSTVFDKTTGKPIGEVALKDHPSQHVKTYWLNCVQEVELQLNPPDMPILGEAIGGDTLAEVAALLPPVAAGDVGKIPKTSKAGRYIVLGKIGNILGLVPKADDTVIASSAWIQAGKSVWNKAKDAIQQTFHFYKQTSGAKALNTALRDGNLDAIVNGFSSDQSGMSVKDHLKNFEHLLVDVPVGSTFVRNMGLSGYGQKPSPLEIKELQQFLLTAESGTVVQEPGFTSTSWSKANKVLESNEIKWEFTAGSGVRMFPAWLSANHGEGEGLLPPGQRYAIIGASKSGNTVKVKAILLPTV